MLRSENFDFGKLFLSKFKLFGNFIVFNNSSLDGLLLTIILS